MNKREVLDGMRCDRLLWWETTEPKAAELRPGEVQLDLYAEGRAVGEAARERNPGGVLIAMPVAALDARRRATAEAMAGGAARVYEAAFEADGVFVAVDILERRGEGWAIVEVKATTSVQPEHVDDVAVQVHVLRAAGIPVVAAELLHLNKECRAPDLSDLFTRADLTAKVERRLPEVDQAIARARAVLAGPLPAVPVGAQCRRGKADECPFAARCWKDEPAHHVRTLYYIGQKWVDLAAGGHATIFELPDAVKLPKPETYRQVRSVKAGARLVEPGLGAALSTWPRPIAYLDFETVSSAIPHYPGSGPWEQVPAQFSVHHDAARPGDPHPEWIADREADPRPALAAALLTACRGAETLVAYNAEFERGCLKRLGEAVPAHAAELAAIEARLVDALPVVRAHVYDPAFAGGFSLKKVLPALVPELPGYGALAVQEGQLASLLLKRLLRGEPADPRERDRIRAELLKYCALDTYGLAQLVGRLRELGS